MSRTLSILVTMLALVIAPVSVRAERLSNGVDTDRAGAPPPTDLAGSPCGVLWFTSNLIPDEISRLASLGIAITTTGSLANLSPANLSNYDVLVVEATGPGSIGSARGAIQAFVGSGHGLLIHQPNAPGTLDYTPAGFDVSVLSFWWCGVEGGSGNYLATIVDGSHPITTGLTDLDLSGDFDKAGPLGPGYSVLTRNSVCGTPSLAAGNYSSGRVAFDTGLACPCSIDPGTNHYWAQLFSWLCAAPLTPARRETWGSLKVHYR